MHTYHNGEQMHFLSTVSEAVDCGKLWNDFVAIYQFRVKYGIKYSKFDILENATTFKNKIYVVTIYGWKGGI